MGCSLDAIVGSAAERQLKLALEKGALGNSLTAGTNSDKCGAVAKVMGACKFLLC